MSTLVHAAAALAAAHPLTAWAVASFVLNALLALRTPAQWVALAERSPRVAALARLLTALGIDPVRALDALAQFVSGKARKAGR